MRMKHLPVTLAVCGALALSLSSREAAAQAVPPSAVRDGNWGTVSDVSMVLNVATPFLMPRVYYSDPTATAGWKGRWHWSMLAPAMTLTALTVMVEVPMKDGIESTRPGCTLDETNVRFPNSNCETFGGPSTHAFAAWAGTGAGTGIFLVDTLKYSNGRFSVPGFIGNVAFPLTASIVTTIARDVAPAGTNSYESGGQIVAGGLPGFFVGLGVGAAYAALQRPSCGYGGSLFCW